MAFTMHSHSGQFCPGHARDGLEAVVRAAAARGLHTMGLTEHMPRTSVGDLYPDELPAGRDPTDADRAAALAELAPRHERFLAEARRLQVALAGGGGGRGEGGEEEEGEKVGGGEERDGGAP